MWFKMATLCISASMCRNFVSVLSCLLLPYIVCWGNANPRLDKPPKLVLQLVLGSLRSEVVDVHWEELSAGGLARIYSRGVVCQDARYNHLVSNASNGLATLATGADVSQHGITDGSWFSHVTNIKERFAEDDFTHTVGSNMATGAGVSPRKLLVSSLTDSWRQSYPTSRLYAVAYDANDAVLLGGRSADAVLWFEPKSGNWVTSSYYANELPQWVQSFNNKNLAPAYSKAYWEATPMPTRAAVEELALRRRRGEKADTALRTEISVSGQGYSRLLYTPSGNSMLRDLIMTAVEQAALGRGSVPDLLSVYFTPFERIAELYGQESAQFRDALLRFDKELSTLLEYLDLTIGKKEYLVVVTSAYATDPSPWLLSQWQIPSGYFSPDKAVYMLASYLDALYGVKNAVVGYSAQSIYLNERILEKSHLPLQQVEQTAAKFLDDMSGVAAVYPMHVVQWGGAGNKRITRALGGFHPKRSGHLLIDLMPGWVVQSSLSTKARNSNYSYEDRVPLVMYGWKLQPRKIVTPIYVRDVVATLSRLLFLREPNASIGNPIPGVGDWDDVR